MGLTGYANEANSTKYDENIDYFSIMLECAESDFYEAYLYGKNAEELRNAKIDDLGIKSQPKTFFFAEWKENREIYRDLRLYSAQYDVWNDFMRKMIECADKATFLESEIGEIYENRRNEKIITNKLNYATTSFFIDNRNTPEKVSDLIRKYNDTYKTPVTNDSNLPSIESYMGNISHYCAGWCCNGQWAGQTASGVEPYIGMCALPSKYPLGTKIRVTYKNGRQGIYICEDRGGAIVGNKVDIFVGTHSEAMSRGRFNAKVEIIRWGR